MRRTVGLSSLVSVGLGAAAIWLSKKPNRIQAKSYLRQMKRKLSPPSYSQSTQRVIEKGGNPHPRDLEDNEMVSEGAMYSVDYYNDKLQ
ncbi:hypothetical protein R4Z10_19180 [Niallia sp. XMNu-256]|uniref:hypothetical protein n=1 Tax=Niallia sp. XMNu-256 TaxID=3082444 RepID=UPI0030D40555